MRIAVCEDNAAELDAICGCIEEYCKRNCYLNKIHRFTSGEALIAAFAPGEFDIIFLDIYLDGMSGVEAARKICEADPDCLLVFITISEDYTKESYSVDAISYIVKPVESGKIDHTLDKCRHEFHKNSRVIRVPAGYGETVDIPLRAIRYVEVCGKEVIFHLGKSTFTARMTLDEIEETLGGEPFLRCQRSYIVNMNYVDEVREQSFQMKNKEIVPIGRRKQIETKLAMARYITRGALEE